MYHTSKHSGIGQVISSDTAGIEALFTDAIRDHVAQNATANAALAASSATDTVRLVPMDFSPEICYTGISESELSQTPQTLATQDAPHIPYSVGEGFPRGVFVSHDLTYAEILSDCELGRLCKNRHETTEYVLWNYGHKFALGSGKITRDGLFLHAIALGLTTNRRTFNSWIHDGMGLYWRERGGYLYLTSWKKLAARITKSAVTYNPKYPERYHPDWVATNLPGQQRVILDLSGSLQSVHAALYGGWIAVKAAKNGFLDISRYTATKLWHCSKRALLGYEKRLGIRVEERYAESADIHSPFVPAHATLHIDKDGKEFASWRLSNRYYPPNIQIHPHNGQRRKIRALCHDRLDNAAPANSSGGGRLRVERTGKLYFEDRVTKKGIALGHKRLHKHLVKHQDAGLRPHYTYMVRRYGKHIYEVSTGDRIRSDRAEVDLRVERTAAFELRRMQYRIGWQGRG